MTTTAASNDAANAVANRSKNLRGGLFGAPHKEKKVDLADVLRAEESSKQQVLLVGFGEELLASLPSLAENKAGVDARSLQEKPKKEKKKAKKAKKEKKEKKEKKKKKDKRGLRYSDEGEEDSDGDESTISGEFPAEQIGM